MPQKMINMHHTWRENWVKWWDGSKETRKQDSRDEQQLYQTKDYACFNDSLLTSKRSEQKGYEACVHWQTKCPFSNKTSFQSNIHYIIDMDSWVMSIYAHWQTKKEHQEIAQIHIKGLNTRWNGNNTTILVKSKKI